MMSPIKEPDLALAGVALLVMFAFLMWHDSPLKSSRPLDPYVQHQNPNATGHAYESQFWEDPFFFYPPDPKEEKSKGYCKEQLIEEIKATENPVKILAPLLKVRPDTLENRELRTRHRYAVIAGLIESGYRPLKQGYRRLAPGHRPLEPGHLHFCSSQENSGDQEYDVRWEHYSRESQDDLVQGKSDVIVVWMNSEIFIDDNRFGVMSRNLLGEKKIIKDNFYVYDLNDILDQDRSAEIRRKIINVNKNYVNENIKLIKPAGSDTAPAGSDTALTKLAEELKLRNIKEPSDEVMIITEQDSENARNLTSTFCRHFSEDKKSDACKSNGIKNVFYLKGLDANQLIIDKQDKNEGHQGSSKQTDRRAVIDLHDPSPLPVGPSQVDYLHRLAKEIKDSHNDIDIDKRDSGIKAVGIFGSDFNDKLRILEALRAEMPEILVFTTDLDAQMFSPQHWQAARNLVVASHFDLRLDPEYQEHFPGFRDSQQTNIFYHTIKLFKDGVTIPENILPKIFEIGRNGPVHLAQEKDEQKKGDESSIDPLDNAQEQATKQLMLLGGITIFLILFLGQVRPYSNYLIGGLFFGSLIIFSIAFVFAIDASGEPLSFKDGTSLWPTIFIQIIATLLACAFIFSTKRILEDNSKYINRQYFTAIPNTVDNEPSSYWTRIKSSIKTFRSKWVAIIVAILVCIIFIASSLAYTVNDVYPSKFSFILCIEWLVFIALVYYLIIVLFKKGEKFLFIKDWAEKEGSNILELNALWREYCAYGQFEHRAARVVATWLFFAIIETLLIYVLPPWPSPCRGDTCDWAAWVGVISFVVIMILLFFILDAVRLNYFWIQKLRTKHPLLVGRTILTYDLKALKTFDDARRNKVASLRALEQIIDLVAVRTLKVDRLIYFPMLCIMLMLFARTAYFDNQEFPLSKGITFAASISLLFFAGFMLRNEAGHLKHSVIKCAENLGKDYFSCKTEADAVINRAKKTEVNEVINRINNVNKGAFEPMFEQPVMRATLIILASIGIFAAKYLKLFE